MNVADRITITRIVLIPFFVAMVLYGKFTLALAVFLTATVSDVLDGFVARKLKIKTKFGSIIDPLADKFLVISAYICMVLVKDPKFYIHLPLYVAVIVISRDIMILVGSMVVYMVKGELDVKPSMAGKLTTALQMFTIIAMLVQFKYTLLLANIMVLFTAYSGLDYMVRGSKLLNNHNGGTNA